MADRAAPWIVFFLPADTEGRCDRADHSECTTKGCYAAFQVVALGDQHDTLRKCGRWMNAQRRASSMGAPRSRSASIQKNQYASREEYESWQQLEWFRPPFQIRSTKFN